MARWADVSCFTQVARSISKTLSELIGMVVQKPTHKNLRARSEPDRALVVVGSACLGQRLQRLGIQHDDGAVLEAHPFA